MPSERRRLIYAVLGAVVLHAIAIWGLGAGLRRQPQTGMTPPAPLHAVLDQPAAVRTAPSGAGATPVAAPARPTTPQAVTQTAARAQAPLPDATSEPRPAATAPPVSTPPASATTSPGTAPTSPAAAGSVGQAAALAPAQGGALGASPASPGPVAAAAAAPTGQAAPRVEPPSANADYLNNPRPPYPPMSRRLGEAGRVTVQVLIAADGTPSQASVARSSGFDRLDQAAVSAVMRWRFVPGKRAGVPEAMWFSVPVDFVLE